MSAKKLRAVAKLNEHKRAEVLKARKERKAEKHARASEIEAKEVIMKCAKLAESGIFSLTTRKRLLKGTVKILKQEGYLIKEESDYHGNPNHYIYWGETGCCTCQ